MRLSLGRRRHGHANEDVVGVPRSMVHILETPDELREALLRASEFDERTSEALRTRTQHYRTLATNLSGSTKLDRQNTKDPRATDSVAGGAGSPC